MKYFLIEKERLLGFLENSKFSFFQIDIKSVKYVEGLDVILSC
jgi:hypothetical protein